MIILPAIDLKDGQVVRLYKGEFNTVHQVARDPLAAARDFFAAGAAVAARLDPRFPFDQSEAAYHIHDLRDLLDILSCREES